MEKTTSRSMTAILLVSGEVLIIDAKARRGRDGRLGLRFGEPYLRARADAKELLESIENVPE